MKASKLRELIAKATPGPWFKRYCDDVDHMCMTVISSKDYGEVNTGQFKDEPDTIAATFHQVAPVIGDLYDCNEGSTNLILHLVNNAEAIAELIEAAEMVSHTTTDSKASGYLAEALAKIKEQP